MQSQVWAAPDADSLQTPGLPLPSTALPPGEASPVPAAHAQSAPFQVTLSRLAWLCSGLVPPWVLLSCWGVGGEMRCPGWGKGGEHLLSRLSGNCSPDHGPSLLILQRVSPKSLQTPV